jgi:hypothetical protein
MKNRLKRLNEAVAYLKGRQIIKNQQDIVNALNAHKTPVSLAFKGNAKYLTDNFLMRFCKCFTDINFDYLISGEGTMLKTEVEQKNSTHNKNIDILIETNAKLVSKLDKIDELENKIKQLLLEIENLKKLRPVGSGDRAAN